MGAGRVRGEVRGTVERGNAYAGRVGFPTANIRASNLLQPGAWVGEVHMPTPAGPRGWYGCVVAVAGGWAEVHIIGWRGAELAGTELHVVRMRRIPDELMSRMLAVTLAAAL